jgi:oligo-1,6-glucosidase
MKKYSLIIIGAVLLLLSSACNTKNNKSQANVIGNSTDTAKKWWKEAIIYQLYPRSFKDSDGDGIGDLKGITSKLDYIKSLGVTAIWLNPIYSSPNDDNGYDVSDYQNIMKDFGTMADFDTLLQGMHQRGLKLVMDIVVNHSSDEHEWFKQSRGSRNSPYRNYYHWWNAERGKPPYRYSLFDVNHDAWMYDSTTNAYYLHYFSRKQPDLNWENPKLRNEIYSMMAFWAKKGVDGFRLDAFGFAAKDTTFPVWPNGYEKNFMQYYAMGPNLHSYLKEMHTAVFSKYDVFSVAEGAGNTMQDAHELVDADRKELHMAYPFEAVDIAKKDGYSLLHFKQVFSKWDSNFATKGWLSIFLANHDQARMVSRFGNDKPEFRELSNKMLNTFILSMRGTPYCYNGDELAMSNAYFNKIEDYNDVATLNEYQYQKNNGGDLNKFMQNVMFTCRDNGRTPFHWDNTTNAGFTTGTPWLKVNPNYTTINVAVQNPDANSPLNYFKKLTALRKNNRALIYGAYQIIDKDNPSVYAYTRAYEGKQFLVVLNFTNKPAKVKLGINITNAKVAISNYSNPFVNSILQPYEAIIFEL